MNEYGFNTGLLHGTNEKYPQGATQVPIYQSSAFRHDSAEDLEKIFDNKKIPSSLGLNIKYGDQYGIRTRECRRERAVC